jgi:hypothetical protein
MRYYLSQCCLHSLGTTPCSGKRWTIPDTAWILDHMTFMFCFRKKALKNHEKIIEMAQLCSDAMVHGVLWGMDPIVSVSVRCWTHCPWKILLMASFLCPKQSPDGVHLNQPLTIKCSNMHTKLCAQFLTGSYMMQTF